MRKSPDLTEREKAVIYYAIYAGIEDFKTLWQISRDKAADEADPRKNSSVVSMWKNSNKVRTYWNQVEREKAHQEEQIRIQTKKEIEIERLNQESKQGEETETPKGKNSSSDVVNFQDRTQFLQYLNKQANLIQDPKLKADYLKMLSDLLRFKESETGKDNEIQRFYTPLNCSKCPLYQEKSEIKTEK